MELGVESVIVCSGYLTECSEVREGESRKNMEGTKSGA